MEVDVQGVRLRHRLTISGDRSQRSWVSGYVRRLILTDAAVVTIAVLAAQWLRFGSDGALVPAGATSVPVGLVSVVLIGAWLAALRGTHSLDRRILGAGPLEYSRVVTACLCVFGLLAMLDLLFRLNIARGFIALALPIGTLGLLAGRRYWRAGLHRQRLLAKNLDDVVVVGAVSSAAPMIERLAAQPQLGYRVVGACVPATAYSPDLCVPSGGGDVPVLGCFDQVREAVIRCGATTVAITSADALGHQAMQELSWDLEGINVDMLISPGVLDVAGPRMLMRPVAGLPLLHIDKPRYDGANRTRKALLDRLGAATLLLFMMPTLLLVALAVKIDSRGPIFYRSTRVGLNNQPFEMWKFRSMVVGADSERAALAAQNQAAGVMFKMREDPRVTRVGRIIRAYSIDEVPQLFNVVGGSMSLVGPRPPLPNEVARYDGRVARRMLVKPGMTGLWQVSGRSDLSWEESVRLDLSYVENWSIMQDLVILWRTVHAVFAREGAY
ncbi:putative glycosyltransferase [Gordonia soli NBRC 108243]|uniref:Putative glycosyltransferase n=1 Tax=Gordonia soli NBRC 108243 TaxID=1223545 RepID=M0QM60_9ACTN|nr:putative glycosyltransferase [Gordonia soli NBRC 108243]